MFVEPNSHHREDVWQSPEMFGGTGVGIPQAEGKKEYPSRFPTKAETRIGLNPPPNHTTWNNGLGRLISTEKPLTADHCRWNILQILKKEDQLLTKTRREVFRSALETLGQMRFASFQRRERKIAHHRRRYVIGLIAKNSYPSPAEAGRRLHQRIELLQKGMLNEEIMNSLKSQDLAELRNVEVNPMTTTMWQNEVDNYSHVVPSKGALYKKSGHPYVEKELSQVPVPVNVNCFMNPEAEPSEKGDRAPSIQDPRDGYITKYSLEELMALHPKFKDMPLLVKLLKPGKGYNFLTAKRQGQKKVDAGYFTQQGPGDVNPRDNQDSQDFSNYEAVNFDGYRYCANEIPVNPNDAQNSSSAPPVANPTVISQPVQSQPSVSQERERARLKRVEPTLGGVIRRPKGGRQVCYMSQHAQDQAFVQGVQRLKRPHTEPLCRHTPAQHQHHYEQVALQHHEQIKQSVSHPRQPASHSMQSASHPRQSTNHQRDYYYVRPLMNHYERPGGQFREQPTKARSLDEPGMAVRRSHGHNLRRKAVDPSFKHQHPVNHVDNHNHHHHERRYSAEIPTVYSEYTQPSAEHKRMGFTTHQPASQDDRWSSHPNMNRRNPNMNRRIKVDSRPIPSNPRSEQRAPIGRFEGQHHINQEFQPRGKPRVAHNHNWDRQPRNVYPGAGPEQHSQRQVMHPAAVNEVIEPGHTREPPASFSQPSGGPGSWEEKRKQTRDHSYTYQQHGSQQPQAHVHPSHGQVQDFPVDTPVPVYSEPQSQVYDGQRGRPRIRQNRHAGAAPHRQNVEWYPQQNLTPDIQIQQSCRTNEAQREDPKADDDDNSSSDWGESQELPKQQPQPLAKRGRKGAMGYVNQRTNNSQKPRKVQATPRGPPNPAKAGLIMGPHSTSDFESERRGKLKETIKKKEDESTYIECMLDFKAESN